MGRNAGDTCGMWGNAGFFGEKHGGRSGTEMVGSSAYLACVSGEGFGDVGGGAILGSVALSLFLSLSLSFIFSKNKTRRGKREKNIYRERTNKANRSIRTKFSFWNGNTCIPFANPFRGTIGGFREYLILCPRLPIPSDAFLKPDLTDLIDLTLSCTTSAVAHSLTQSFTHQLSALFSYLIPFHSTSQSGAFQHA